MADDTKDLSAAEADQVNNLIQGRAKRSTAGRHMSALLNAEADDDLALLFEEVEDDNDFFEDVDPEAGDEDDVLESSSDDDDQGPNAQDDELEGEQELQKEAKAENKKRKKQQQPFNLQALRKRVKIDPVAVPADSADANADAGAGAGADADAAAATAAAPRPKKKSERISWIPTVDEGPTRSSSRRQTMQNKQVTHEKLKDSEQKRVRLIATMEEAAKRKAHLKPKEMTQTERLAEAERVERHNSKSLNRWEEMEKRKADERIAKIEALQNRRLEGPVMSYWSGIATWADGRLTRVGKADITQKLERDENNRKKSKKTEKDDKNGSGQKPSQLVADEIPIAQMTPTPAPAPENAQKPVSGDGEAVKQDQVSLDQGIDSNVVRIQGSEQPNQENDDKNPQEKEESMRTTDAKATEVPATGNDAPGTEEPPSTEETREDPASEVFKGGDAMDIDEKPTEASNETGPEAQEAPKPSAEIKTDITPKETSPLASAQAAPEIATSSTAAPTAEPESIQTEKAPTPTPQEQLAPEIHMDQPGPTASEGDPGPQIPPQPPAIIEQTGRTLTILENFDDKTAHSREFSTYFNAKKPPRLTSTWNPVPLAPPSYPLSTTIPYDMELTRKMQKYHRHCA